jgi:hypothetical protein
MSGRWRQQPWLATFPLSFRAGSVRRSGGQLFVTDGATVALPLEPGQATVVRPLLQLDSCDGFGLWDGYFFTLCWAQTALGRWVSA